MHFAKHLKSSHSHRHSHSDRLHGRGILLVSWSPVIHLSLFHFTLLSLSLALSLFVSLSIFLSLSLASQFNKAKAATTFPAHGHIPGSHSLLLVLSIPFSLYFPSLLHPLRLFAPQQPLLIVLWKDKRGNPFWRLQPQAAGAALATEAWARAREGAIVGATVTVTVIITIHRQQQQQRQ